MEGTSQDRCSLLVSIIVGVLLSGCATIKIQAPYDSFVCFNSTFNDCANSAQAGSLKTLPGPHRLLATGGYVFDDPDAGKLPSTTDKKYQCTFGITPYAQTLDPGKPSVAVFVSPVLLREIGEQQVRLTRARTACERLIQTYEYQQQVLALQDKLSMNQKAIAILSDEVESERLVKESVGSPRPVPRG